MPTSVIYRQFRIFPVSSFDDRLIVKLERTRNDANPAEVSLTKNEATVYLAAAKSTQLEHVKEWDLYLALTQFRTIVTLHFLNDVQGTLKKLSNCFQGEDLTPSSLQIGLERTYDELELMKTIDGASLKDFYSKFDELTDTYMGHNMEDHELGQDLFERDRQELLDSTIIFMKGRFDSLLSHDVLRWMRDSLEHRRWPSKDDPALTDWGTDSLAQFAKHYSGLTLMKDFDIAEAQHEFLL